MSRIHDKTPVLKTLFRFDIPKPGDQLWKQYREVKSVEEMTLAIEIYDTLISEKLLQKQLPYIVRCAYSEDGNGFLVMEETFRKRWKAEAPFFGVRILVELHPMFDKKTAINDLYNVLRELSEDYLLGESEEGNEIKVDWDERYAYIGAHVVGLQTG